MKKRTGTRIPESVAPPGDFDAMVLELLGDTIAVRYDEQFTCR